MIQTLVEKIVLSQNVQYEVKRESEMQQPQVEGIYLNPNLFKIQESANVQKLTFNSLYYI